MPNYHNFLTAITNLNTVGYKLDYSDNNSILHRFGHFFCYTLAQDIQQLNAELLKRNLNKVKEQITPQETRIAAEIITEIFIGIKTFQIQDIINIKEFLYNASLAEYLQIESPEITKKQTQYAESIARFSKLIDESILKITKNKNPARILTISQQVLQDIVSKQPAHQLNLTKIPQIITNLTQNFSDKERSITQTIANLHTALNLHYQPEKINLKVQSNAIILHMIHNIPYTKRIAENHQGSLGANTLFSIYKTHHYYIIHSDAHTVKEKKQFLLNIIYNSCSSNLQTLKINAKNLRQLRHFYITTIVGSTELMHDTTRKNKTRLTKPLDENTLTSCITTLQQVYQNAPEKFDTNINCLTHTLQTKHFAHQSHMQYIALTSLIMQKEITATTNPEQIQRLEGRKIQEKKEKEVLKTKMLLLPRKITTTYNIPQIHLIISELLKTTLQYEDMSYAAYDVKYITHCRTLETITFEDLTQISIFLQKETRITSMILREIKKDIQQDVQDIIWCYTNEMSYTIQSAQFVQNFIDTTGKAKKILNKQLKQIESTIEKLGVDKEYPLQSLEKATKTLNSFMNLATQELKPTYETLTIMQGSSQYQTQIQAADVIYNLIQNLEIRNLQINGLQSILNQEITDITKAQQPCANVIQNAPSIQKIETILTTGLFDLKIFEEAIQEYQKLETSKLTILKQKQILEKQTTYNHLYMAISSLLQNTNVNPIHITGQINNNIELQIQYLKRYNPLNTQAISHYISKNIKITFIPKQEISEIIKTLKNTAQYHGDYTQQRDGATRPKGLLSTPTNTNTTHSTTPYQHPPAAQITHRNTQQAYHPPTYDFDPEQTEWQQYNFYSAQTEWQQYDFDPEQTEWQQYDFYHAQKAQQQYDFYHAQTAQQQYDFYHAQTAQQQYDFYHAQTAQQQYDFYHAQKAQQQHPPAAQITHRNTQQAYHPFTQSTWQQYDFHGAEQKYHRCSEQHDLLSNAGIHTTEQTILNSNTNIPYRNRYDSTSSTGTLLQDWNDLCPGTSTFPEQQCQSENSGSKLPSLRRLRQKSDSHSEEQNYSSNSRSAYSEDQHIPENSRSAYSEDQHISENSGSKLPSLRRLHQKSGSHSEEQNYSSNSRSAYSEDPQSLHSNKDKLRKFYQKQHSPTTKNEKFLETILNLATNIDTLSEKQQELAMEIYKPSQKQQNIILNTNIFLTLLETIYKEINIYLQFVHNLSEDADIFTQWPVGLNKTTQILYQKQHNLIQNTSTLKQLLKNLAKKTKKIHQKHHELKTEERTLSQNTYQSSTILNEYYLKQHSLAIKTNAFSQSLYSLCQSIGFLHMQQQDLTKEIYTLLYTLQDLSQNENANHQHSLHQEPKTLNKEQDEFSQFPIRPNIKADTFLHEQQILAQNDSLNYPPQAHQEQLWRQQTNPQKKEMPGTTLTTTSITRHYSSYESITKHRF